MRYLSALPITTVLFSSIDGGVVLDVRLSLNGPNGTVKIEWVFFATDERHEEVHADLATALIRVGVLVSTTEHERVREYRGTSDEFARRARDFIVTTTV